MQTTTKRKHVYDGEQINKRLWEHGYFSVTQKNSLSKIFLTRNQKENDLEQRKKNSYTYSDIKYVMSSLDNLPK